MADNILGRNKVFPIYNEDGTVFHNLVLRKSTVDSVVMSLGDKITGDVYYKDTTLAVTMGEYIVYNDVKYTLVNPPTVVKEGMVSDNGDLNGMTKYSFVFYHPMYHLLNFPFTDVAVQTGQEKYLSQNKSFSWIGTLVDYVAKINKNLQGTQWICAISSNVPQEERTALSEVMAFENATIADALKRGYETWEVPYIIDQIKEGETYYSQGKRFLIQFGLPSQEIIDSNNQPFVFKYGQGVGLKNHSRNPRNNKIITRIAGYGSEDNIPWGYPQIVWTGNQGWKYTVNNDPTAANSYPIYDGVVGGAKVKLIKHPFTRTHLMPSIYRDTVNKKVNPNASGYNPSIEIKDYYDADSTYANPMVQGSPSYEIHEFEKIKPELGVSQIVGAVPYSGTVASDGEILLSDFKLKVMERASSTSIDMERTALLGLYDNITLPSSYVDSGSQEAYSYQSSIGAPTDDKRRVEFKSSNVNFSEVVVVPNETPSSSTEWIDDIDENGNYIQGYFEITLPILSFDLYASAALTQEMQINMRSGACIGCTFPVQVDWEDYRKNFYDAEGNFAPNGAQRNLTKYPKSDEQQITVIVQKDTNTFGTLMPNIYQKPAAGDEYVILGISLPLSYISDAEERLDADMKQYMRDNNVYYFDYPLKFDEYFLAKNINILSQLRTNTIVRFQYNSEQLALYVKQLIIKYDNTPLPQYDITLTDDVEIVLNPVGQVSDDVSKLRMLIGQGGVGNGSTTFDSNAPFVRKDIDDTTNNIIRILNGLQLGENFSTGLLGEGGIIRVDADGKTYVEADKLYVRMKFYADTVEVRRFLHTGGNSIKSVAGINCTRVEYIDSNGNVTSDPEEAARYRCYFKATDNDRKITNDFVVGDLAFCGETNVGDGSLSQHRYWRAVVGRNAEGVTNANNEMWIDLSDTDCEAGSSIPLAQDDIIQLGNKTDTTRQGAIIEYVSGEDSPSYMIYQDIDSYSLVGKNKLALGFNSETHRAYMNVYGDFFVGDPDGSYIRYNQETKRLDVKAELDVSYTLDDGRPLSEVGTIDGNIILNSGFTGDFESEEVNVSSNVNEDTVIWSYEFKYWETKYAKVIDGESKSGKAAYIDSVSGYIKQDIGFLSAGWYMLSFGCSVLYMNVDFCGDVRDVERGMNYGRQEFVFHLDNQMPNAYLKFSGYGTVCDVMLTHGVISREWLPSTKDNDRAMAQFYADEYLRNAITEAHTKILGGLILTQLIKVGSYSDGEFSKETGGMSGLHNTDSSPFIWGGGSMAQAIDTIKKYENDPKYIPTEQDIANMAKFVVTHGGRAILNDIILRGYIYALGGVIGGMNVDRERIGIAPDPSNANAKGVEITKDGIYVFEDLPSGTSVTNGVKFRISTSRPLVQDAFVRIDNQGNRTASPWETAFKIVGDNYGYCIVTEWGNNRFVGGLTEISQLRLLDTMYVNTNDGLKTGVTQNVGVGNQTLHFVNGILVDVTSE